MIGKGILTVVVRLGSLGDLLLFYRLKDFLVSVKLLFVLLFEFWLEFLAKLGWELVDLVYFYFYCLDLLFCLDGFSADD